VPKKRQTRQAAASWMQAACAYAGVEKKKSDQSSSSLWRVFGYMWRARRSVPRVREEETTHRPTP
jgi:hypothetical protein